jgi:predicted phosphate transport protein (TIGR00153 family)
MFGALISKDKAFFEMFEKSAANVAVGAKALNDLMQTYPEALGEKVSTIKDIEHAGDDVTHQTIEMLNKTFVTPIDREDIHQLITKLDDILDLMDGASGRLALYKIDVITPEAKSFAELLIKGTGILAQAVSGLRDMKNSKETMTYCVNVHTVENEGDNLLRKAMTTLFEREKDNPINVIKWKEIYEDLETAIDYCEDVANVIEGIILKYA